MTSMFRAKIPRYHLNLPIPHGIRPLQLRTNKRSSIVRYDNGYSRCSLSASAGYHNTKSVQSSETMFKEVFHIPSHLPGLSATYLFSYSSLHSLYFLTVCILFLSRTFVNTLFLSQTQSDKFPFDNSTLTSARALAIM